MSHPFSHPHLPNPVFPPGTSHPPTPKAAAFTVSRTYGMTPYSPRPMDPPPSLSPSSNRMTSPQPLPPLTLPNEQPHVVRRLDALWPNLPPPLDTEGLDTPTGSTSAPAASPTSVSASASSRRAANFPRLLLNLHAAIDAVYLATAEQAGCTTIPHVPHLRQAAIVLENAMTDLHRIGHAVHVALAPPPPPRSAATTSATTASASAAPPQVAAGQQGEDTEGREISSLSASQRLNNFTDDFEGGGTPTPDRTSTGTAAGAKVTATAATTVTTTTTSPVVHTPPTSPGHNPTPSIATDTAGDALRTALLRCVRERRHRVATETTRLARQARRAEERLAARQRADETREREERGKQGARERRQERSQLNRQAHLDRISSRAREEWEKVSEVKFINALQAQNRRMELSGKHKEAEERRRARLDEIRLRATTRRKSLVDGDLDLHQERTGKDNAANPAGPREPRRKKPGKGGRGRHGSGQSSDAGDSTVVPSTGMYASVVHPHTHGSGSVSHTNTNTNQKGKPSKRSLSRKQGRPHMMSGRDGSSSSVVVPHFLPTKQHSKRRKQLRRKVGENLKEIAEIQTLLAEPGHALRRLPAGAGEGPPLPGPVTEAEAVALAEHAEHVLRAALTRLPGPFPWLEAVDALAAAVAVIHTHPTSMSNKTETRPTMATGGRSHIADNDQAYPTLASYVSSASNTSSRAPSPASSGRVPVSTTATAATTSPAMSGSVWSPAVQAAHGRVGQLLMLLSDLTIGGGSTPASAAEAAGHVRRAGAVGALTRLLKMSLALPRRLAPGHLCRLIMLVRYLLRHPANARLIMGAPDLVTRTTARVMTHVDDIVRSPDAARVDPTTHASPVDVAGELMNLLADILAASYAIASDMGIGGVLPTASKKAEHTAKENRDPATTRYEKHADADQEPGPISTSTLMTSSTFKSKATPVQTTGRVTARLAHLFGEHAFHCGLAYRVHDVFALHEAQLASGTVSGSTATKTNNRKVTKTMEEDEKTVKDAPSSCPSSAEVPSWVLAALRLLDVVTSTHHGVPRITPAAFAFFKETALCRLTSLLAALFFRAKEVDDDAARYAHQKNHHNHRAVAIFNPTLVSAARLAFQVLHALVAAFAEATGRVIERDALLPELAFVLQHTVTLCSAAGAVTTTGTTTTATMEAGESSTTGGADGLIMDQKTETETATGTETTVSDLVDPPISSSLLNEAERTALLAESLAFMSRLGRINVDLREALGHWGAEMPLLSVLLTRVPPDLAATTVRRDSTIVEMGTGRRASTSVARVACHAHLLARVASDSFATEFAGWLPTPTWGSDASGPGPDPGAAGFGGSYHPNHPDLTLAWSDSDSNDDEVEIDVDVEVEKEKARASGAKARKTHNVPASSDTGTTTTRPVDNDGGHNRVSSMTEESPRSWPTRSTRETSPSGSGSGSGEGQKDSWRDEEDGGAGFGLGCGGGDEMESVTVRDLCLMVALSLAEASPAICGMLSALPAPAWAEAKAIAEGPTNRETLEDDGRDLDRDPGRLESSLDALSSWATRTQTRTGFLASAGISERRFRSMRSFVDLSLAKRRLGHGATGVEFGDGSRGASPALGLVIPHLKTA